MQFAKVARPAAKDAGDARQTFSIGGAGVADPEDVGVFLPHGSVYVMSEEARYGWTHGIDGRVEDLVQDEHNPNVAHPIVRSMRVSITFRWLLPGADVVGGLPDAVSTY